MPRKPSNEQFIINRYRWEAQNKDAKPAERLHALAQLQHLLGLTKKPVDVPDGATVIMPLPVPTDPVEAMLKRNADKRRSNADKLPEGSH